MIHTVIYIHIRIHTYTHTPAAGRGRRSGERPSVTGTASLPNPIQSTRYRPNIYINTVYA